MSCLAEGEIKTDHLVDKVVFELQVIEHQTPANNICGRTDRRLGHSEGVRPCHLVPKLFQFVLVFQMVYHTCCAVACKQGCIVVAAQVAVLAEPVLVFAVGRQLPLSLLICSLWVKLSMVIE